MEYNALIPELSVSDFAESLSFYKDVLGFAVEYQREEEGFAFLSFGDAQLMLDSADKGRTWRTGEFAYPLGRGVNFQIAVADATAMVSRLRDDGVVLFGELEETWYRRGDSEVGVRQFLLQDPDGYLLRFAEDLGSRLVSV